MQTALCFDIETRRHPGLRLALKVDANLEKIQELDVDQLKTFADIHGIALGNRKNPEAVRAKCEQHFNDILSKAALKQYGSYICSIAVKDMAGVVDDLEEVRAGTPLKEVDGYEPPVVWSIDDPKNEKSLIELFFQHLVVNYHEDVMLTGFNIRGTGPGRKGFDIPMLRVRCAMLGLVWPHWLPKTLGEDRRYNGRLFDICDVLGEGSCDTWLAMAGLPMKSSSGADVEDMSLEELSIYNANDVECERLLAGLVMQTQDHTIQNLLYRHD